MTVRSPSGSRSNWCAICYREFCNNGGRVFGVVLDTSGSMDRTLLGKALGAIASYSISRDVLAGRVVFCDARATMPATLPRRTSPGACRYAVAVARMPC